MPNVAWKQWRRVPNVYNGAAVGGAAGAAGAAFNNRTCLQWETLSPCCLVLVRASRNLKSSIGLRSRVLGGTHRPLVGQADRFD